MQMVVFRWRKIVLRYYLNYLMKIILIVNVIKQALARSFLSEGKCQGVPCLKKGIMSLYIRHLVRVVEVGLTCVSLTQMLVSL